MVEKLREADFTWNIEFGLKHLFNFWTLSYFISANQSIPIVVCTQLKDRAIFVTFLVFRRVSSKELQVCWAFRAVVFCIVSKESPIASVLKVITTFLIVLIMLKYYLFFFQLFWVWYYILGYFWLSACIAAIKPKGLSLDHGLTLVALKTLVFGEEGIYIRTDCQDASKETNFKLVRWKWLDL